MRVKPSRVIALAVGILVCGATLARAQTATSASFRIYQQGVGAGGSTVTGTNYTDDGTTLHSFHIAHSECRGTLTPSATKGGRLGYITQFSCPPAAPTGETQLKSDTLTVISTGAYTNETTVVFEALVTTVDPPCDQGQLQVEIQLVGTSFTNNPTDVGTMANSGLASQVTATALASGNYHWQFRTQDTHGGTSSWTSFGGNLETVADFSVDTAVPTAPGGSSAQVRTRTTRARSPSTGHSPPAQMMSRSPTMRSFAVTMAGPSPSSP
ncbi:MAG: hypothetical protein HYY93_11565 [Planctomycetes bacterium]|nr:hypothetical protein [Planctomycetota bacterium]